MHLGTTQTLIYDEGGTSITLVLNEDDYLSTGTDNFLSAYGYDRQLDPEFATDALISSAGTSFWFGRNLEPHICQWNLYLVPEAAYLLQGMVLRQQREKKPVLLLDQRLPIQEPTPRTRAKAGTFIPDFAIPGTIFYWPILKLKLDAVFTEVVGCDRQIVALSGKEILPYPTTAEDR
jgi:hypothetical protein